MNVLKFLKLGGSLITDKSGVEAPRLDVIERAAKEIAAGLAASPATRLVVGHGSGSFGHVSARRHGTREGVSGADSWRGFAEVSLVAARLNALVAEALYRAGVPVLKLQPSATALCSSGELVSMEIEPVRRALDGGLVPLVYGDVAFDRDIGGTIISTEEIFAYLAREMHPESIWLAGEGAGVLDSRQQLITTLASADADNLRQIVGASGGTDVTGGMASKVLSMLELCAVVPDLTVHIFGGLEDSYIKQAIAGGTVPGTTLRAG